MKKSTLIKLFLLTSVLALLSSLYPKKSFSIPAKNVRDTLSSSQFSYYGRVGVGNSGGSSILTINTSTANPSQTTNNLFVGDTITVGVGGSQTNYIVKDVASTSTILVYPVLTTGSAIAGGGIIATRSAIHTVSFEPQTTSNGGSWQVLIKAPDSPEISNGIPDQTGFDALPLGTANITCPYGGVASIGTTTLSSGLYHLISCSTPDGNPIGAGQTGVIIIGNATGQLINPSPSHPATDEGYANIFNFILRRLDSSGNITEESNGKIAIVESVRVTATIDPTLSFYIDNVGVNGVGSTVCGTGNGTLSAGAVNTTGDSVVFGSLGLGVINQLAQRVSCVTNAPGGYVVTAYEQGTMKNINTDTTIPDTLCNGSNCTTTLATAWSGASTTRSEFGYTFYAGGLGSSIPFTEGQWKPFAIGYQNAQPVMINPKTPSQTESANVCYRITATTTQEAGEYEAKVVYTATATF